MLPNTRKDRADFAIDSVDNTRLAHFVERSQQLYPLLKVTAIAAILPCNFAGDEGLACSEPDKEVRQQAERTSAGGLIDDRYRIVSITYTEVDVDAVHDMRAVGKCGCVGRTVCKLAKAAQLMHQPSAEYISVVHEAGEVERTAGNHPEFVYARLVILCESVDVIWGKHSRDTRIQALVGSTGIARCRLQELTVSEEVQPVIALVINAGQQVGISASGIVGRSTDPG